MSPKARTLLADKGYDADWFRAALAERKIDACPSPSSREVPVPHDPVLCSKRHKIKNLCGKVKNWRRIHRRYGRCARTYFSSICITGTFIFRL
ncbi:transposase [Agrobacterium rosae]|nr:transposase [Agrobacterium rosae]KAA3513477.1 transposase [Agrobacterium rosae]MQB51033.1 transposase [Agrobacterium rosae]